MKLFIKQISYFLILLLLAGFMACGGGGGGGGGEAPSSSDPLSASDGILMSGLNTGSASSGSVITITGENFPVGTNESLVILFIKDGNGFGNFSPSTIENTIVTFILPAFPPDNYQVQILKFGATEGAGPVAWSNKLDFQILPSLSGEAPGVPTGLTVNSATSSSLTLSWTSVSNATSYTVYRWDGLAGSFVSLGTTSSVSYTDSSLSPNTTYYYNVSASNSYGESYQSSSQSGSTSTSGGIIPGVPDGLSVGSPTSGSLTVSWNSVTGADGYRLYRSTVYNSGYSLISASSNISYVDSGLNQNTTYYYKIAAYNSTGESSQSSYQSATTSGSIPSTPSGLSIESTTSSSLTVTWSSASGATSYKVYRSGSSNGVYSLLGSSTSLSYLDSSLSSSTSYYYKVSASNSNGDSAQSSSQSGTTLATGETIPTTPTGLSVGSITSSSLTISWNPVSGATGYRLYRSAISNGSYTLINSPSSTSYSDTGLSSSTPYYYKISAYNGTGESTQSSYQTATTSGVAPSTPTGFSVNSVTSTSITITWSTVSGATSYNVYRSSSSSGTYSLVGTSTVGLFLNSGLTGNTTYYYKVSAVNSNGESAQSSYFSGKTGFVVGNGVLSIPLGTYSYTTGGVTVSYVFSTGNGCQMITGATTYSGSYSYNASNGNLSMTFNIGSGMSMVQNFIEVFTVPYGSTTMLFIPGSKKTNTNLTDIAGATFQSQFTTAIPGYSSTTTTQTLVFNANGTYTFSATGSSTSTHNWNPATNTADDCFFAIYNGYLYAGGGYTKQ